jgi:hypothetical protein
VSGKCGRCRGRGSVKSAVGFEMALCPDCDGRGVKVQKPSLGRNRASIHLPRGSRCIVCNGPAVQMHHLCKQQRIEREVPAELLRAALTDPRGGVPTCLVNGCHGLLEEESIELASAKLPNGFWDYVKDFDLYPTLPRYLVEALA